MHDQMENRDTQPRLPNFLGIGTQRAGSTWLHRVLRSHPDVFMPKRKELEYFSYASGPKAIDHDQYAWYFSKVNDEPIVGEVTPSYLWAGVVPQPWSSKPTGFETDIPSRVRDVLGNDVKLIAILRDPVERALSGFLMHIRKGRLQPTQSILHVGNQAGIIALGFYAAHLAAWQRVFPVDNMLILDFNRLTRHPLATYRHVCNFLQISSEDPPASVDRAANRGPKYFYTASGDLQMDREAVTTDGRSLANEVIATATELDRLREIYAEDVRQLSDMVSFDVSNWLP